MVAGVARDTDDGKRFPRVRELVGDMLADGAGLAEIELRERLVYHADGKAGGGIPRADVAAEQDGDADGGEVVGADAVKARRDVAAFLRLVAFHGDAVARFAAAEETVGGISNGANTGKAGESSLKLAVDDGQPVAGVTGREKISAKQQEL